MLFCSMRSITRALYQKVLYRAAQEAGVEIRLGCHVSSINQDLPAALLSDGEKIEADLIIGADGENYFFTNYAYENI